MATFGSDIYTLLTSDATLNALVGNRIYYEKLPDNYTLSDCWVVYTFRKSEQVNALSSKNAYSSWNIYIMVQDIKTDTLEIISNRIMTVLNNNSYGSIADIWFVSDNHTTDLDRNVFMNNLEFGAFYTS